jgi:hypothetical protein
MNSEFNGCYPTPYWIFTGPVEAVLAGGQGWNGVFRCGQPADAARFFKAQPIRQIGTGYSPVMMFSERIGALLFAQGDVKALPRRVPFVITPEYLLAKTDLAGGPKYPTSYTQLAFDYQLGTVLLDGKERLDDYPCVVVPADMRAPESLSGKKIFRAEAGLADRLTEFFATDAPPPINQWKRDTATGAAQIVTSRAETFLLPAEAGEAQGKCVHISGNQSVAVCFAGSLDRQSLADSGRVLALYLTDVKNTGTEVEYQPKDSVVVRKPGLLPLLVRQGTVEMAFQLPQGRALPQVWALKYDGGRTAKIEPHRTAEGFSFEARAVTDPETFSAFELVWSE